jgi:hypothetical protein
MQISMRPQISAAISFAVLAAGLIAIWVLLVTYSLPDGTSVLAGTASTMRSAIFPATGINWQYLGLALLPIPLLALSVSYFSALATRRRWAMALFALTSLVTLYCLVFVLALGIALCFVSFVSFRCIRLST